MYGVILMLSAATGGEASACPPAAHHPFVTYHAPVIYHPPVLHCPPAASAGEAESDDQEAKVYPQTDADKRRLKEIMQWIDDPKEGKKVLEYWLAPGTDSKARKEFYLELKKEATGEEDDVAEDAACTIVVTLPESARLEIQGEATTSTGSRRTFVSPTLPGGKTFRYNLTATFERDGELVTVEKSVQVWAGANLEVTLDDAE